MATSSITGNCHYSKAHTAAAAAAAVAPFFRMGINIHAYIAGPRSKLRGQDILF